MSNNLASRLKQETADLHTQAEQAGVIEALIHGRISREQYCLLLRNLVVIYQPLENGLSHLQEHSCLAPFGFPTLFRLAPLSNDLVELHGPDWRERLPVCPAAAAYQDRLESGYAAKAEQLLAHAYVRYLGDLSGGQMLKKLVAQTLHLPPGQSVSFYDFGTPAEVARHLINFKSALGQLTLTDKQQCEVIEEAKWAFESHIRIANQLMAIPSCTNQ